MTAWLSRLIPWGLLRKASFLPPRLTPHHTLFPTCRPQRPHRSLLFCSASLEFFLLACSLDTGALRGPVSSRPGSRRISRHQFQPHPPRCMASHTPWCHTLFSRFHMNPLLPHVSGPKAISPTTHPSQPEPTVICDLSFFTHTSDPPDNDTSACERPLNSIPSILSLKGIFGRHEPDHLAHHSFYEMLQWLAIGYRIKAVSPFRSPSLLLPSQRAREQAFNYSVTQGHLTFYAFKPVCAALRLPSSFLPRNSYTTSSESSSTLPLLWWLPRSHATFPVSRASVQTPTTNRQHLGHSPSGCMDSTPTPSDRSGAWEGLAARGFLQNN